MILIMLTLIWSYKIIPKIYLTVTILWVYAEGTLKGPGYMTTLFQATKALLPEAFCFLDTDNLADDLWLIPASAMFYGCEAEDCTSRQTLTERTYVDEDGDAYYNVLCGLHRAQEVR